MSARGFTILEILIAVVITSVGFAAIFAMQIGTMQGNIAARETAGAVTLGERYIEQLREDAFLWNQAAPPGPRLNKPAGRWHTLTPLPVDQNGLPAAADAGGQGSDLPRQRFCVHYWIDPMRNVYDGIINARVRVAWPRAALSNGEELDGACREIGADAFTGAVRNWYTFVIPATIRRHPPSS